MEFKQHEQPDIPPYLPQEVKHGTTTLALTYKDGVIMAADNRASAGYMVASPKAKKLHILAKSTAMSIAGSVSDAQYVIKLMRAEINLFEMNRGKSMPTRMIGNLLGQVLYGQYRSYFPYFIGPILAGVDKQGPHIYPMDIAGSMTEEPFASTGSGSPYALGVLQAMYEKDMPEEEAKKTALLALRSAILKDIATGDGIDLLIINKDGVKKAPKEEIIRILGDKYPFRSD